MKIIIKILIKIINKSNNYNNNIGLAPSSCNTISSAELLPIQDDEFSIKDINFLNDVEFRVGLQTQSLRNANVGLRSEPPNPQVKVSPWLNSTIEPDLQRRPLEESNCQ